MPKISWSLCVKTFPEQGGGAFCQYQLYVTAKKLQLGSGCGKFWGCRDCLWEWGPCSYCSLNLRADFHCAWNQGWECCHGQLDWHKGSHYNNSRCTLVVRLFSETFRTTSAISDKIGQPRIGQLRCIHLKLFRSEKIQSYLAWKNFMSSHM